jgi:Zinc carboxypeptidase
MINVPDVLRAVPHFEIFCSVDRLLALVDTIRADPRQLATVKVVGTSVNGAPIHHVRFGKGSVRALLVAFPHPNEPVGAMTVFSMLTLLHAGHRGLLDADVEWHIVPCIDPDGARLNEGWSQKPFTVENYLKEFHRQELGDQVECSFPIQYKRWRFDRPTREAAILQRLLTEIRPDYYFSLHNAALGGGVYYLLTRDVGKPIYRQLRELLRQYRVPMQDRVQSSWLPEIEPGIAETGSSEAHYDELEKTIAHPEEIMPYGACSWEYLGRIKDSALTFVAELPYVKHPSGGSKVETGLNLRQLRLRMDADNKFIATVILDEWDKVKADLDVDSPFYRKINHGLILLRERLHEGLPSWPSKTRDVLCNPAYNKAMTEGERFNVYLERFFMLCQQHEFVRLLKASRQTPAVKQATERVSAVIDAALADISSNIDFTRFEVIDCDTLVRVQLGSGLIVLNSLLERPACIGKH